MLTLCKETVPDALYRRHLGVPAAATLEPVLADRTEHARAWFAAHAQPFLVSRELGIQRIVYAVIHLTDQTQLHSAMLASGFARAGVDQLVAVGITAGQAVDDRIDHLWQSGHPDEAMFLNAYAIAAVEHWRDEAKRQLQQVFAEERRTVLPHYSPGYDGWGLADQARLFRLLQAEGSPLRLLDSGGLLPHKSTLAVYGVTPRDDLEQPLDHYWSCRTSPSCTAAQSHRYAFPERTLRKWRDQRLTMTANSETTLRATFRFDGSTCSNLGVPIAYDFCVDLERDATGYRIARSTCVPTPGHQGYQSMCAYLDDAERFSTQLDQYRPLVGEYLHESLGWTAPISPAGCLCSKASQNHKWRIVYQTIHFALEHDE